MARRMSRRLVAISTAAIATVFSIGYVHTQPAAAQLAAADSPAIGTPARGQFARAASAPATATPAALVPAFTPAPFPARRSDHSEGSRQRDRANSDSPRFLRPAPTRTPAPTITATGTAPVAHYRDGSYTGMGENRHGDVQVTVTISSGRIASAAIFDCGMQYPCSRIAMLPGEVLSRQSTDVDLVSGATMSSTAYQDAVLQALAKATA